MVWSTEVIDFIERNGMAGHFNLSPYYKGNPQHRKAGLLVNMTTEEANEYLKCSQDIVYFAERYCNLHVSPHSELIINSPVRYSVNRHDPATRYTDAYAVTVLHDLLFSPHRTVLHLANQRQAGVELVSRVKYLYEQLPFVLKPGINTWNDTSLSFDSGSRLRCSIVNGNSVGIGFTIDHLLLDVNNVQPMPLHTLYTSIFPTITALRYSKLSIMGDAGGRIDAAIQKYWTPASPTSAFQVNDFSLAPLIASQPDHLATIEQLITEHKLDVQSVIALCKKLKGSAS